ncbi:outer membrane protein W [Psychrobacter sp. PL19]|uniref:OmpW/AlkL family protein n=1 Tax=Psychrobacter sp. PL19 TaxID=2760711 RepID=UPI001AE3B471
MKKILTLVCTITVPLLFSQTAFAGFDYFKTDGSFKRFSISAGVLHAAPQGDPNPLRNTSAIEDITVSTSDNLPVEALQGAFSPIADFVNTLAGGEVTFGGAESFTSPNTGLQADNATTLGLLINYHITDNWSIETKAGFPPKVNILGVGQAFTPITGTVNAGVGGQNLPERQFIRNEPITDLEQGDGVAARARAWLPAAEVHYQFGKTGVNKFRPYVGAGVIYAYFNGVELNPGIREDLEDNGHRVQNFNNGNLAAALAGQDSDSDIMIDVAAGEDIAPIFTIGATYDFNESFFAVGSVSYAKLSSNSTIIATNDAGEELFRSKSVVDIDPFISYFGLGYRY